MVTLSLPTAALQLLERQRRKEVKRKFTDSSKGYLAHETLSEVLKNNSARGLGIEAKLHQVSIGDIPVFKVELKGSRKEREEQLEHLKESSILIRENQKYLGITGPTIEQVERDLVEKGHAYFFIRYGQVMLLPSLTKKKRFCHDENAHVPLLFLAKERKLTEKQAELEVGKPEVDASPGTLDKFTGQTAFEVVEKAGEGQPGLAKDVERIVKEAADDLEQHKKTDEEMRKHEKRIRYAKDYALTTTFAEDKEVRDRILGSGERPAKVESVAETVAPPAKKFGLAYVSMVHQQKKLPIVDFKPLSSERDPNADLDANVMQSIRDYAATSMGEDVQAIDLKGKKMEIVCGDNLACHVIYHGKKPWRLRKHLERIVKKVEGTHYNAIKNYDGNPEPVQDAIETAKSEFDSLEEKIKDENRKLAAVAGAALVLIPTLFGFLGAPFLVGKPGGGNGGNGVTPDTNNAPTLEPIPDSTVLAEDEFYFEVPANDADLARGDVLTFTDDNPYFDIIKLDERTGAIRWTPAKEHVGKHPVKITVTDKYGKSATQGFNITVKEKPIIPTDNLPPELVEASLNQLSKYDYELIVKARNQVGDDYPGYEIQAFLNKGLIGSSTDSDLARLLNITDERFATGDNQIDILLRDKLDQTKNTTRALFLHKNLPPVVSLDVLKIDGDRYKLTIDANSFDDELDKIQIFVGEQLYKEVNPSGSQLALEEELDLTQYVGDKTIRVKAVDKFGDSDEASEIVTCQNDLTAVSIDFQEVEHELWSYTISFDGIDNNISQVEVKNPVLGNKVFTPNMQNGRVSDRINLTSELPGTYNVTFELTDDLGLKVSEQRTIVLDNDRATYIYNVTNSSDMVTVRIDASDPDTNISKLDVDFAGEHNITNPNNKVVSFEYTFDATNRAPGNAYVSAEVTDELGQKQSLFNESVSIIDDQSIVESAEARYNPINEIIKVYNGAARDVDTNLENILYQLRNSGNTTVRSGSLVPTDGSFNSKSEGFNGTVDTSGLPAGSYTLEIIPRSNGIDGQISTKQVEINRTYEIIPVWNPDKNATIGQLEWNFTSGKADFHLEGNNTYFSNWQDEWTAVNSLLKQAVIQNWTSVVVTSDPFATATNVQGKVRDILGTTFSDADTYNSSRKQFVASLEYIKDDTLNNASVSAADKAKWQNFFVTNIAVHDGGVGDWRQNMLYSYFGNNSIQKVISSGPVAGDYSWLKSQSSYTITEYNEYKTATSQAQALYEAKSAINFWGKIAVNWSNIDIDEATIIKMLSWVDVPSQTNVGKLQRTLQTIDTYQKLNPPTQNLKVRYDSGLDNCKFWNA